MNNKDKTEVLKYLRTQIIATVATKGKFLWPANVYFLVDDELNLYFMSDPKTRHGQNIKVDNEVALSIVDSHQAMSGDKIGVQINGTCKRVNGLIHAKRILSAWKKSNHVVNLLSLEPFEKAAKSGIYKVEPKIIKFYNTKIYKDKFKEWKL